ncbi:MAG: cytochrome ubiquinol oxidase subunit I [Syntrophobacterales bacterium]|jgi:cytochrome d ubiquinol oxidase subunit I
MDVAILSRIQFFLTVSFHFLFPPLTIGLGVMLIVMQAFWVWTRQPLYHDMARFWTRVFGLIFAMGVASGIPMVFQFGTNWATYSRFVGDVFGSPLAIEGIYAFFLESGFLALLLFGWNKIGPRTHFFSTCMVALGAHFSAIWILVANSWMQTPAGFHLVRQVKVAASGQVFPLTASLGNTSYTIKEVLLPANYVLRPEDLSSVRAVVDNIWDVILNPSTLDRISHTLAACWLAGAFLVIGVSAYYLLRNRHVESARSSLRMALVFGAISSIIMFISADSTARGVAYNQPTKLAAMEGLAQTQKDAPLGLGGIVQWQRNAEGQITGIKEKALRIPALLSILVSGDFLHPLKASETVVEGLAQLPSDEFLRARYPGTSAAELAKIRPQYWPNVPVLFQTYHLMIAIGMALLGLSFLGCLLWAIGRLWRTQSTAIRAFLWLLVGSALLPIIATQVGWMTAEMGRQPWIVYGILKTSEAISPVVKGPQVLSSIILFFFIYALLLILFLFLLFRMIGQGPRETVPDKSLPEGWQPLSLKEGRQTRGGEV